MLELIFFGRGGQGAKTAAALVAEVAFAEGKQVQSFPEYGAERHGAPVRAFTRISDTPILVHSAIEHPDIVVVIDSTLIRNINVTEGLDPEKGILIVDTDDSLDEVRRRTGFQGRIIAIDATKIAQETLGKPIPNTAMLGVLAKTTRVVQRDFLVQYIRSHFARKLGEEMTQKNIDAFNRAYDEVPA